MRTSFTQRLARTCARRSGRTITAWVAFVLVAIGSIAMLLGGAITTEGNVTTEPDSVKGMNLLDERFASRDPVTELVVLRPESGTVQDAAFQQQTSDLRQEIAGMDGVVSVGDPTGPQGAALVSADGQAALLPVVTNDTAETGIVDVIDAVETADASENLSAAMTGDWTVGHDFLTVSEQDLRKGELQFGLPAALIVLLLVFGAVVAASVPLVMAVVSIITALGIAALVGQTVDLSFFIINMVVAMGLALGIDYSLFVVSRYREERHAGEEKLDAIAVSGATASKAVFFSGTSFVVALLGLLLVPDTVLRSLAFGAIVVGIVTVAAAL